MPAYVRVNPGDPMQAAQLNQVIDSLTGAVGKGVPLAVTAVNDATNYALAIQNDDATNSRALLVQKQDGTTLIQADINGVVLALANASVPNAALASDTARANLCTNGGFEIWQRGSGAFTATGAYGPDRWAIGLAASDTLSISKDTTNVDASSGAAAACVFTLSGGAGSTRIDHKLEDYLELRGRTLTVSLRVRTSTASAVRVALNDGTLTYSSFHSGSGVYETLTVTKAMSASATSALIQVYFAVSCTAYLDNAMLVVGSQAAAFAPLHPADDLARCLRYYETLQAPATTGLQVAFAFNTTAVPFLWAYMASKAVTPTITFAAAGAYSVYNAAGGTIACTSVSMINAGLSRAQCQANVASGLVAGNATMLNATTGFQAGLTAEANV